MTFLELVNKRESVRKYSKAPVPRETINRCLEAARLAPSACNAQPWGFIVVDDPALKDKISDAAFSGAYSMCSFAKSAPVLVIVTRQKSGGFASVGGFCRGVQYNLIDIGIACEHFILQAAEEGVGTCWLGWFNGRRVGKALKLPRGKRADIIISMGYPQEPGVREKMRKPMDEISGFNKSGVA